MLPSGAMKFRQALAVFVLVARAAALSIGGKHMHVARDSDGLQDVVSLPYFDGNLSEVDHRSKL
jgi:hypothetical protein